VWVYVICGETRDGIPLDGLAGGKRVTELALVGMVEEGVQRKTRAHLPLPDGEM
jgi:hypothetical protein